MSVWIYRVACFEDVQRMEEVRDHAQCRLWCSQLYTFGLCYRDLVIQIRKQKFIQVNNWFLTNESGRPVGRYGEVIKTSQRYMLYERKARLVQYCFSPPIFFCNSCITPSVYATTQGLFVSSFVIISTFNNYKYDAQTSIRFACIIKFISLTLDINSSFMVENQHFIKK